MAASRRQRRLDLAGLAGLCLAIGLAVAVVVTDLAPRSWTGHARGGDRVASSTDPTPEGQETDNPLPSGVVAGTVSEGGEPVAGVRVTALTPPYEPFATGPGKPLMAAGPTWSTTTDEDGAYALPDVTLGSVKVEFASDEHAVELNGDAPTLELAPELHLASREQELDVDAELAPGARILGTVRPARAGRSLHHTSVTAELRVDEGWVSAAYAQTGPQGTYVLDRLPAGRYRVRVEHEASGVVYHPTALRPDAATSFVLTSGEEVTGVDVSVPEPGRLSGRVLAADGSPLARAKVTLYTGMQYAPREGAAFVLGPEEVRTDAEGYFEARLPTGHYSLWVGQAAYPMPCHGALATLEGISVRAGGATTREVRVPSRSTVTGVVTDEQGRPLPSTPVVALPGKRGCHVEGTTDADGRYRFTGVEPGTYSLMFGSVGTRYFPAFHGGGRTSADAATFEVEPGRVHSGLDGVLREAGRVVGRVRLPGDRPPRLVTVHAKQRGVPRDRAYYGYAELDRQGRYELVGLPRGVYRLTFLSTEPTPGGHQDRERHYYAEGVATRLRDEAVLVAASPGTTTDAGSTRLDLSAAISGRALGADGEPRPDVGVRAYREVEGRWRMVAMTFPRRDGRWVLRGLAPDTYRIGFSGNDYYPQAPTRLEADDIRVGSGETVTGIDAEVETPW